MTESVKDVEHSLSISEGYIKRMIGNALTQLKDAAKATLSQIGVAPNGFNKGEVVKID